MSSRLVALVAVSVSLAACGKPPAPAAEAKPFAPATVVPPTGPSYWKDVAPIVEAKCLSCHTAGGIGSFTFDDYGTVKALAEAMAQETKAKRMPPWPPARGCGEFLDDRSLSDAQQKVIAEWAATGAREGSRADKPPSDAKPLESLGIPSIVVAQASPYTSTTVDSDDYRCFVVDPKVTSDQFVTATGIHPGNAKIVHHVILFEAPEGQLAKVQALDDKEPGEGYTCFGGPGFDNTAWITSWAPGALPARFPEGTGIRIRKGSKLIMQVHYNLANGRGESDQTKVDLYFSSAPVKEAAILPIPQVLLSIPKDAKTAEVGFDYTLAPTDRAGMIYGAAGHMHLLGKKFSMTITHKDGSSECLLSLPQYDFAWQGMYMYRKPLAIGPGDTMKMSCVYDNSPENQPIINGVRQVSKDVTWGEKTTDEMCLGLVYVTGF